MPGEETFGGLVLAVPAGFSRRDDTRDPIGSLIPGAAPAIEHFRSYVGAKGKGMYLFCWEGLSGRDRGPMVAAESWQQMLDGQVAAKVSRTSIFFGRKREVLVAHFEGPQPRPFRYLVYTDRVDKAWFEELLQSVRFPR